MTTVNESALERLTTRDLWERRRLLNQAKHAGSPGRRITAVERELGAIKRILHKRSKQHQLQEG
jgi:hypothetical protein